MVEQTSNSCGSDLEARDALGFLVGKLVRQRWEMPRLFRDRVQPQGDRRRAMTAKKGALAHVRGRGSRA